MSATGQVTVEFFGIPRHRAGRAELAVPAGTVAELLAAVERACPALAGLVRDGRVLGFRHEGYWQDIGTLDSYYRANLDLLRPAPPFPLDDPRWPVFTPSTEFPPARIGPRKRSV